MLSFLKSTLASILHWVNRMLSDENGPSCGRTITSLFALFSLWVMHKVTILLVTIKDPMLLTIWISNFPLCCASLAGFILAPYSVSKGSGAVSNVVNAIANVKMRKNTDTPKEGV